MHFKGHRACDNHCQFNDNEWEMHSYELQTRGIHESYNGANHHSEKWAHLKACWSVAAPEDEHAKHNNFYFLCAFYGELFFTLICCHSCILNVIYWLKNLFCGRTVLFGLLAVYEMWTMSSYSLCVCKRGTMQSTKFLFSVSSQFVSNSVKLTPNCRE